MFVILYTIFILSSIAETPSTEDTSSNEKEVSNSPESVPTITNGNSDLEFLFHVAPTHHSPPIEDQDTLHSSNMKPTVLTPIIPGTVLGPGCGPFAPKKSGW